MTLKDIIDKITFFNKIKTERERIRNVEFFSTMSNCIAVGYNYGKNGKHKVIKEFNKNLRKVFDTEKEE